MNAASFFSLETPAGATPTVESSVSPVPESLTTGNLEAFAALVDEAFVRTAPAPMELPVLELAVPPAEYIRPAILLDPNLIVLPQVATEATSEIEEDSSPPSDELSKPERPKAEPMPGLDILLLSQSFFVAPTLPVNWVVPAALPAGSAAKSGDEPAPVVESTIGGEARSASQAGGSAQVLFEPVPSVRTEAQELTVPLAEKVPLLRSDVAPAAARESARVSTAPPKKAQAVQVESSKLISGTPQAVHVDNAGRLDLVEMGFKPVVDEPLPSPANSPGASVAGVSPGTAAPAKLPEHVSTSMEFEMQKDVDVAWSQPLGESSSNSQESRPQPAVTVPVEKVTLYAPSPLPDVPTVTSNALRFAPVPMAPAPSAPVAVEQGTPAVAATGAELPIARAESAIVAQSSPEMKAAGNAPKKSPKPSKAPADAGLFAIESAPAQMLGRRGTPAAKEELRMESLSNAEQAGTGPTTGGTDDVAEESPSTGAGPMLRDRDADSAEFSRNVGATDWQTGRPVSRNDRPAPDSHAVRGPETARTVEQLSGLVMRETAVLKQHTPDSMAVVLRPDANTELFMHLTQRDGHIEASVRCERGNFDQINALWPQLQESLAGQKVRLAPLQESTEPQRDPQGAPGHTMNFTESDQRSRRQSMPEDDSTSDRPSSAPPSTVSLHPERRRSGTRPTASRPGWETWA